MAKIKIYLLTGVAYHGNDYRYRYESAFSKYCITRNESGLYDTIDRLAIDHHLGEYRISHDSTNFFEFGEIKVELIATSGRGATVCI